MSFVKPSEIVKKEKYQAEIVITEAKTFYFFIIINGGASSMPVLSIFYHSTLAICDPKFLSVSPGTTVTGIDNQEFLLCSF